jgi:DNA modification methylase
MEIKTYLGDCLDIMQSLPDGSIDAIICDPPYGTTACKWDSVIDFGLMWAQLNRLIKPNGAIVLFGSEPFSSALRMSNIKNYKYDWIWIKNTPTGIAQAKFSPMRYSELLSVFYAALPTYNAQLIERTEGSKRRCRTPITNGGGGEHIKLKSKLTQYDPILKNPANVIYFNTPPNSKGKYHPTQKPVKLMEYLIKTYTNEGETILDFTMGSGSTGVAAKNTNRNFIGIEQDPAYYQIACNRLEDDL